MAGSPLQEIAKTMNISVQPVKDVTADIFTKLKKDLKISATTITGYLTDIDKQIREQRKAKIFSMYLAGYTMQEIADAVGFEKSTVTKETEDLVKISSLAKNHQVFATFQDSEFETPIRQTGIIYAI